MKGNKRSQRANAQLASLQATLNDQEEEEEEEAVVARPATVFGFANLDEAEDQDEDVQDSQGEPDPKPLPETTAKKRKKKRKKASAVPHAKDSPPAVPAGPAEKEQDDIDQALAELGLQAVPMSKTSSPPTSPLNSAGVVQQMRSLLSVDVKHLDADAELRKMFGARVVNASRAALPPANQRQNRKFRAPPLKHPSQLSKSQPYWPPIHLVKFGAAMEVDPAASSDCFGPEEEIWFSVGHSKYYKECQAEFLDAVASNDVGRFYALLQRNPYHIDTLMALADMAVMQGDAGRSDEFVEQALYAYEFAATTGFSLVNGSAKLNFAKIENRPMFRALDRKVTSLIKRGCYQTAFETAKALFLLDPWSDPYGALLHFEFLAPKARQGKWFLGFLESYPAILERAQLSSDPRGPLVENIPGLLFAKSLCLFDLEEESGKDHAGSSKSLLEAVLTFPYLAHRLADKNGLATPSAFQSSKRAQIKDSWQSKTPDMYLHLLAALYVERCHALWKPPELQEWLLQTLSQAGPLLENTSDPHVARGIALATGKGLRIEAKAQMPANLARHVIAAEVPAIRALYPPGVLGLVGNSYDPLPPPDGTSYDSNYFAGIDRFRSISRAFDRPAGGENGPELLRQLRQIAGNMGDLGPEEQQAVAEQVAMLAEEQEDDVDPEEAGLLRNALARLLGNLWPGGGQQDD